MAEPIAVSDLDDPKEQDKASMLDEEQEQKEEIEDRRGQHCQYHERSMGHFVKDCQDFLKLAQEMMDKGIIEFCKETEG